MRNRNLFFVTNDFNINKSYIQNLLENPDITETEYPFKPINNNVLDSLKETLNCNDCVVFDLFKYYYLKLRNIFIVNPNNIDTSELSELCEESNTVTNYGAVKNLNPRLFPIKYFYEYCIANSKTYNDDGTTNDCPNGITFSNMTKLEHEYNLKEYVYKFIDEVLSVTFNSHDLLSNKTLRQYDEITHRITYIVDNFYSFIFNEIFSKYNKTDTFYKTVLLIKNVAIPLLILDLYSFISNFKMNFFSKSLLSNIIASLGLTEMNYTDAFYMIHSINDRTSQFRDVIIINSFLTKEDLLNDSHFLFDEFQNILFIKLVNDSKYENLLSTVGEISYPGFSTQIWKTYSFYNKFDLFLNYNDSLDLDDDTKSEIQKALFVMKYDNSLHERNSKLLSTRIGIINYNYSDNKNLNQYYVVDKLDDIVDIKDKELGIYYGYIYCMNEDITRDDLTDYLDNNELPNNFEFYIDLETLELDYKNNPDDFNDFIEKLKSYNIILSCLVSINSLEYDDVIFYNKTFNNVGIKINTLDDIILLKKSQYSIGMFYTAFLKDNTLPIEYYLTLKSILLNHNKIDKVISYY